MAGRRVRRAVGRTCHRSDRMARTGRNPPSSAGSGHPAGVCGCRAFGTTARRKRKRTTMAEIPESFPSVNAPAKPLRRKLLVRGCTLLALPVIPSLAHAATILAVRTWPADEYTRVTLEMDTELKAEHFTVENPNRLVVDIDGLSMSHAIGDLVSKIKPND